MSSTVVRNAKKKAMDKAVWLPEKTRTNTRKQHQATKAKKGSQLPDSESVIDTEYNEPLWGSQPRSKPKSTKKHSRELTPVSETDDEAEAVMRKRRRLEKKSSVRCNAYKRPSNNECSEQTESEEAEDRSDTDSTRFSAEESDVSDIEDPKSIAKTLSTEIPTFVSGSKAKKSLGLPVDKQSARARKQAAETPVWPDDIISESEEPSSANHSPASLLKSNTSTFVNPSTSLSTIDHASSRATSQVPSTVEKAKSEPDMSDTELKSDVSIIIESGTSTHNSGSRSATELILTKDGKVKLTDQNSVTRQVVQGAILEAKAHMTFTSGYPELTEKASFSRQSLLKAARDRGASSIEKKIQIDDGYASALAGLVEARVPLFRGDLKDEACNQVAAYLRLGSSNCTASASALLVNHRYHYFMKFDDDDVPKPVQNKPYLGDIMVRLMKGRYFNGPKSVGVMFARRFSDIAKNKAKRPEVTIPMVALTATSVYAALFWKAHGAPAKFNFTGNQFSEVYFFHAKFLKDLSAKSPEKFHKLMADIFAAIQYSFARDLMQYNSSATDAEADALAFLDLDGMDED
ncbi:hypothetical protein F4604DRAFT_1677049 [Suillus subluteus]|nr:hypothetical protein F4604DRAFT_1677049 [Suillus subluteus]